MSFQYLWEKQRSKELTDSIAQAIEFFEQKVKLLAQELPGTSFGYIGNVDVHGDDRGWYVFLPHPDRVGGPEDSIPLGPTIELPTCIGNWDKIELAAMRKYRNGKKRT